MPTLDLNKIVPKVVGVKGAAIAFITENTRSSLTYSALEYLARVRKVSIVPQIADDSLDTNDAVEEEGSEVNGYEVALDTSELPPETTAKLYGHRIDSNGGIVEKEGDQPPKVALILEMSMSGGGSKYTVLYCGAAKQHTEEAESKTKTGFTRSLPTINFSFGRALNGLLKYTLRSDAANFKPSVANAWFDEVQFPAPEEASSGNDNTGGEQSNGDGNS